MKNSLKRINEVRLEMRKENLEQMSGYKPKPGHVWNPLLRYPPNRTCFCGKTKLKAKRCCLRKLKSVLSIEDANKAEAYMKMVEKRT